MGAEEGAPRAPTVRSGMDAATVENGLQFLEELKTERLYGPAIPLLGFYVKKMKTCTEIRAPCV